MPQPSRLAGSDLAMPPIYIHSDMKRPEAVVIDTNQPLPKTDKGITVVSSRLQSFEVADAAQATGSPATIDDSGSRPATSMASQLRESLAQSVANQVPGGAHRRVASEQRRTFADSPNGKRRRSAGHVRPESTPGWCNALSGDTCRPHALARGLADQPF
ncbi:hypothetical protein AC630_11210 [Bradyrhizobium sp. AS23.2]|nr:hypothetical protein AC630_11210 [Bradyrhizobium sp. AS23.2]